MNFTSLMRYWVNPRANYSSRILLSLSCVVFPSWWLGYTQAINPLVLGVIACALAENDDNLRGRAKGLALTLTCFTITTFSTDFLFDIPILFAFGLTSSTFAFTMLGAMGSRYSNIASASLLIAIYTMLGETHSTQLGFQPILLVMGALCYGIISIIWLMMWPTQYMQYSLHQVYLALARYFKQVSEHYYPNQISDYHLETVNDAKENANVVNALNQAKFSLVSQIRQGKMTETNQHFLRIYFIAQDIHERISALHSPPKKFKVFFFHYDIMFRLRHMFYIQSQTCKKIAKSLLLKENYNHSPNNIIGLDELNKSITYIKDQKINHSATNKLDTIWHNIVKIEEQLERIDKLDNQLQEEDQNLSDPDVHKFTEKLAKILSQLNLNSLLFRHAIRLSCALLIGYTIIQLFNFSVGYWTLLTILLVSQASYSATRNKLNQRIIGTFFGLLIGTLLLVFFPDPNSQLVFLILFGMLFFTFRSTHYMASTIFITLFVLMSFNQTGNSYDAILPRMIDTLIGCFIAVGVVRYILPDWQAHRMRGIMADAVEANQLYLAQIMIQFRLGKKDNLSYRQARRNAHNKNSELTLAITNMLNEPGRYHSAVKESFRFLYLNHNMLSRISNLGALREQIPADKLNHIITKSQQELFIALNKIKNHLLDSSIDFEETEVLDFDAVYQKIEPDLDNPDLDNKDEYATKLLQELNAVAKHLPEMLDLASFLAKNTLKHSKS